MIGAMLTMVVFILGVILLALGAAIAITWKHCKFRVIMPRFGLLPNQWCAGSHGPIVWRWWQFVAFRIKPLWDCAPGMGSTCIIYTRWGWTYIDFIFQR